MNRKHEVLTVFICAFIFTILFYRQDLGLNLLIFEGITFIWLLLSKQFKLHGKNPITIAAAFVFTSVATVVVHSVFAYLLNFICFFILVGMVIYPGAKSYMLSVGLSYYNVLYSQMRFFKELASPKVSTGKISSYLWRFRIFLIPILIIIVFVTIYRMSNPVFNDLMVSIGDFFDEYVFVIFQNINFFVIITFILGLIINNAIWLRTSVERLIKLDTDATETLTRTRNPRNHKYGRMDLKNEFRAAVFLLVTLNIIILILNGIDVKWIWFRTAWEKEYLMQFVHEGTYLLILSILISIGLVLFYFRGNLNFYSNNKLLKTLSYIWLAQNGIMVISVAIRNYRYIEYFALAYKRIGVFIFLLLVLYGLYTVFVKVHKRKSTFYLFNANSYAMLVVLVATSLVNWDVLIADYNFSHADRAYIHLNYMAELSDNALAEMDVPLAEVNKMKIFEKDEYRGYMSPQEYNDHIAYRKKRFIEYWEAKSLLEWNWAEYSAYNKLKK